MIYSSQLCPRKHKTMSTHYFPLIEGSFTAEEVRRLLLQLIDDKIRYHNTELLRLREISNEELGSVQEKLKTLLTRRSELEQWLIDFPEGRLSITAMVHLTHTATTHPQS